MLSLYKYRAKRADHEYDISFESICSFTIAYEQQNDEKCKTLTLKKKRFHAEPFKAKNGFVRATELKNSFVHTTELKKGFEICNEI